MESKRKKSKFVYNSAGIIGWYGSSKYNVERFLYLLHRITGVGLVIFVFMHILLTSSRISYITWLSAESIIKNPVFDVGLMFVIIGLVFHGLNGIRLIINEYGFLLGKPKKPIYPYRKVLKTKAPMSLVFIMAIIGIILLLIAIYEFLIVWGVIG